MRICIQRASKQQILLHRTKVDSLAIAIGSAHGYYIETPKLDMNRLKEINKAIDTPLVLHGGTGIPDDQLKQAFKLGINKLNLATEYLPCSILRQKTISRSKVKRIIFLASGPIRKKKYRIIYAINYLDNTGCKALLTTLNQLHNVHSIFAKSCKKCRMEYSASKFGIRFKFNSSPVAKV